MKSYTDIEQSKALTKILPLESADMWFGEPIKGIVKPFIGNYMLEMQCREDKDYFKLSAKMVSPAWSLATLLGILPNEIITDDRFECHYQIDIRKYDGGDNTTLYQIAYGNNRGSSGSWHDMINTGEKESLIDCCVQIILKLHELKLL